MNFALIIHKVAKSLLCPFGPKRPKTPIRWLCLRSFSYISEVQDQRLARKRFDMLNQAMELGVYLNRCFDQKADFRITDYRKVRGELPEAPTKLYLRQLKHLEQNRPDSRDWRSVFHYRREVIQISLDYLFRLSRLRSRDVLLPLVSLVQLADDVLDYQTDRELGLPTFLTQTGPSPRELATHFWAELRAHRSPEDRPFVLAGWLVYFFTRVAILCRLD